MNHQEVVNSLVDLHVCYLVRTYPDASIFANVRRHH